MSSSDTGWNRIPQWARRPGTHRFLVPAVILGVSSLLRILYLWEDSASPFFISGGVDSPMYLGRAMGWIKGSWPGPFAFNQPPLYPAWLAVNIQLFANKVALLKVAQAILGSMSCVLVYFIAKKSFRDFSVAVLAASICALNGTLIYFDGQIVSASLELFLQCTILLFLLQAAERERLGWWLGAGAAIGLSAINRGGVLLCVPFVLLWIFKRREWANVRGGESPQGWRADLARVLAIVVPILLCVIPVTVHNFRNDIPRSLPKRIQLESRQAPEKGTLERLLDGEFVLLTSEAGMNFHLGNWPEDRDLNDPNHPMCFQQTNHVSKLPYRDGGVHSASARHAFLMQHTWQKIGEEPFRWVQLMGWKVVQLINGVEIPRNSNIYADREYSTVLSALLWRSFIAFPTGLVIPLGLLGIFLDRGNWRRRFLLSSFLFPRAFFVLSFFVAARLRVPMIPILAIFAAYALCRLIRGFRNGERREMAVPSAILLLLLLFSNAPLVPAETEHGAYEYFKLGNFLTGRGRAEEALVQFRKAVYVGPTSPTANYQLGRELDRLKRPEEAEPYLREALRLDPIFVEAHLRLGGNLQQQDRPEEAKEQFLRVLEIDPGNYFARHALVNMDAEQR